MSYDSYVGKTRNNVRPCAPATVAAGVAEGLAELKRCGIRATRQRVEILRELAGTRAHPDAETIWKAVRQRLPGLSLDTVYRTLKTLVEAGAAARVGALKDRARYEANTAPHHHFVCRACGQVLDFQSADFDRVSPPPGVRKMGRVESIYVELRGVCRACRTAAAGKPSRTRK